MPIINAQYQTLTCDGKDCPNTVTFDPKTFQEVAKANSWLRGVRIVNTVDNRTFAYCSDLCEVSGVEAGKHTETPKVIEAGANVQAQIAAAAEAARKAKEATSALKSGQPVTLHTA